MNSNEPCRDFLRGRCRRSREQCLYSHDETMQSVSLNSKSRGDDNVNGKSGQVCDEFLRGKCTAPDCKLDHPLPCFEFKRHGQCEKGSECAYVHGEDKRIRICMDFTRGQCFRRNCIYRHDGEVASAAPLIRHIDEFRRSPDPRRHRSRSRSPVRRRYDEPLRARDDYYGDRSPPRHDYGPPPPMRGYDQPPYPNHEFGYVDNAPYRDPYPRDPYGYDRPDYGREYRPSRYAPPDARDLEYDSYRRDSLRHDSRRGDRRSRSPPRSRDRRRRNPDPTPKHERICYDWEKGKCWRKDCIFRHGDVLGHPEIPKHERRAMEQRAADERRAAEERRLHQAASGEYAQPFRGPTDFHATDGHVTHHKN